MARNFSGSNPKIDLSDILTARFEDVTDWTVLAFFRYDDVSANACGVVSKWASSTSARQFALRNRTGVSGRLVAPFDNGAIELDTGSILSDNTWYLGAVTCDTGGNVALYCYGMDGTLLGSDTGTHPGDATDLTAPITIGTTDSGSYDMAGDIAHVAYIDRELTTGQILQYLYMPFRFVAQNIPNVQFYLPLDGVSSPEHDWSGNGNSGTLSGTTTSADNPPTNPTIPFGFEGAGATAPEAPVQIPNFPGAMGAGAYTIGGRGGTVYRVTNLNDSGAGSMRNALEASGARIVVFEVAGTIELSDNIQIRSPYITVAGQTAFRNGGEGITLKDAMIQIQTHDVVIRYIRSRPGHFNTTDYGGTLAPNILDCLEISSNSTSADRRMYNILIDHCSFSWGIDNNFGTYHEHKATYDAENITIQWCIFTEPLKYDAEFNSKNVMLNEGFPNLSFIYNLMANARRRNPAVQTGGNTEIINNLMYNMSGTTTFVGDFGVFLNFIGNALEEGTLQTDSNVVVITPSSPPDTAECQIYVEDNLGGERTSTSDPEWWVVSDHYGTGNIASTSYQAVSPYSLNGEPVTVYTRSKAKDLILADAGASLSRDSVDQDTIDDVNNSTGELIQPADLSDGIYPAGSWPDLSNFTPDTDTDSDGMPDTWETSKGLNPSGADDDGYDLHPHYTNIEIYLMEVAGDPSPFHGLSPFGGFLRRRASSNIRR